MLLYITAIPDKIPDHDPIDRSEDVDFVEDSGEEIKIKHPLIELADWIWLMQRPDTLVDQQRKSQLQQQVKDRLQQDHMYPYYTYLQSLATTTTSSAATATSTSTSATTTGTSDALQSILSSISQSTIDEWKSANEKELREIDNKMEEALDTGGDTEYRDAILNKANYYAAIGDKQNSLKYYELTYDKTVGASSQIDVSMALLRISFAFHDIKLIKKYITRSKELIEKGGDWERKNLLQVYESIYNIQTRTFSGASKLLLNSIATFTCYELISYQQFVLYTVISSVIATDRQTLKKSVISAPEILQSIDDIPYLRTFLTSLYDGRYAEYFRSVVELEHTISADPYLSQHLNWIIREIRLVAYQQFLLSYRSVTLKSMADTFGVSDEFLDTELFRFIGSGRISAKIDRVSGVVETVKADTKNRLYADMIQHGDALLNRVQKLTKVFSY